jgi:benzylsuccinate synthase
MPVCKECSKYFPHEEDRTKGDCVHRVIDPRQAYYTSRPVEAHQDADKCSDFEKK